MGRPRKNNEEYIPEQEENTEQPSSSPNSQVMAILKANKKDHYNFEDKVEWEISSGSLLIDSVIGKIKPSLLRFCGQNNEGKTPQVLEVCRNFFENVKNSRGVWFLAEGRLSDENKNRCGIKFTTNIDEWVDGSILIIESNVYELFISTIKDLVLNNPQKKKYAFVVDSLDGLIRREDLAKPPEDATKVCGPQVLSKKMMQSLSIGMFKYGHLLLITSQVTAAPKLNEYAPKIERSGEFSGGNALLHSADWIFEFEKSYNGDFILDNPNGKLNDGKTKVIGKFAKIVIDKANVETAKKIKIQYPIKYGRKPSGIWREREVGDLVLAFSLAKMGGAGWIQFSESIIQEAKEFQLEIKPKIQGMDNLYKYFEENDVICNWFYNKLKNVLT